MSDVILLEARVNCCSHRTRFIGRSRCCFTMENHCVNRVSSSGTLMRPGLTTTTPILPLWLAQAKFWVDFIDKKYVRMSDFMIFLDAGGNIWKTKEAQAVAVKDFIEILKRLEGGLGDKDYFGGDSFGFVDIIAIAITSWFHAFEKFGSFNVEDHTPKLSAWIKRCLQRETVAKVIPDPEKMYEFVIFHKKMNGTE